ncbi:leucyl aminopeptidase family protein [Rubrivirga sp.]|uniref:leucyl aminopeptidase family protein n=1 Tax=Rubrivirga sp. TaxID=1885344 RepID=UPI003B5287C5
MTSLVSGDLFAQPGLLVLPVDGDGPEPWRSALGPAFDTALADATAGKRPALIVREDGARVAVVAVGDEPGAERWRWASASVAGPMGGLGIDRVVLAVPPSDGAETAAALVEGFRLASYRFDAYRTEEAPASPDLAVWTDDAPDDLDAAVRQADVRAEVTSWARDLVNLPPDAKMPAALADRIAETATEAGVACDVWDKARIEAEGMGGLLGVNRGSLDPPRFVVLEWAPDGTESDAPVVLVGKTVTYDTGGLSLKPTKDSMDKMKADMAGGAAVAAAVVGAARLGLKTRVIGLLPMSDNRPGGRAYAPGDVLTMHSGATVEVLNTDAEGRLLLADALSYARGLGPRWVLDAATLTGAQGIALGERVAAVVARDADRALADRVHRAGEATGDLAWPLPLYPHYRDQLKSDVADLKNVGGRMAGTITAAAFLEPFTRTDGEPAFPWVHIDLARPAFLDTAYGYRPTGASGFGVRLLLDLLAEEVEGGR